MRVLALAGALAAVVAFAIDLLHEERGGNFTLEEARAFEEYPLAYAGEEVDGLPLTAILRRDDTARFVSFVYGDCTARSDGGCAPPAEVQVWPASARSVGSFETSAPGSPVPEPTRIRGLPAAFVGETQVELYAPDATVVVFAHTRERALAIADGLRCVRNGTARPRDGPLIC
jgi:hypothetical protein